MFARHVMVVVLAGFLVVALLSTGSAEQVGTAVAGTGIVVAVTGEADVHSASGIQRAVEGLVLESGDTLVVKVGGTCIGFTPDGESFSLEGPSELQLAAEPEGGLAGSVSGWVRSQLTQWIGARHRQPLVTRSVLRDWGQETDVPTPLVPAPEGRVRASNSAFRWARVPGIDVFTVVLVSEMDEEAERVIRGQDATFDDLVPGQEYVWKVQARTGDWTAESSWRGLRVMTTDEEDNLEAALDELGDLEAGVLLLSAGLHEEAIAHFDAAVSAGSDARSARLWRARALADVGLYKQAYDDLMAAGDPE